MSKTAEEILVKMFQMVESFYNKKDIIKVIEEYDEAYHTAKLEEVELIDDAKEFQKQLDEDIAYWTEQKAGIKAWNNS